MRENIKLMVSSLDRSYRNAVIVSVKSREQRCPWMPMVSYRLGRRDQNLVWKRNAVSRLTAISTSLPISTSLR